MRVRMLLRGLYPDDAPGSGGRWELTEDQIANVLDYFHGKPASMHTLTHNPRHEATTGFRSDGLPVEWHWEGHVQAALMRHLVNEGWTIDRFSDTASHEQGPDVAASRPGRSLLVEVKGYPSSGCRDPRRASEVKRTNPSIQAQHWYAAGLLKAIRMQNATREAEVAICLPEFARYVSLINETSSSLSLLGIGVLVVHESGDVSVSVETRRGVLKARGQG
jgi:hypothetical protein